MRSTRVLGSLAAAALALPLLLIWLRRTQDGGGSDSAPERAQTVAAALQEPATDTRAADSSGIRSIESTQRDTLETGAAPEPTCLVRVVEAGSGKPLPDARLWIQREDVDWDGPEWWRAMRRFNDVEPVLAGGFGTEITLDEHGEARVPRPARTLCVAAAHENQHGDTTLEPNAETCVVELEPYHSLTIEVVDRVGKPVPCAPVVFFWGEFDPLEDWNILPADEHGRLAIAKLESQIYERGYRGPVNVSLACGVPCEPALVEFTLENVPRDPVRFVAGEFGSLLLQLTDPQGHELELEGNANLEIATYTLEEPPLTLRAGASPYMPLEKGRALFPCLGLGFSLEVNCTAKGHEGWWREVAGPTAAGEEVRVLIPVGERFALVRGHVNSAGTGGMLRGRPTSGWPNFWARIEHDGTFEQPLGAARKLEHLVGPWELELLCPDRPKLRAAVVPRMDTEHLVIDFGSFALDPLAELARVRVTDGRGEPMMARIEIRSASNGDGAWTDDRGVFVLDGQAEDLPTRLRATHEAWLASEWVEVTARGTEATLSLRPGASLEGRVLLPRGGNLEACGLDLTVAPSAAGREASEYGVEPVEGGRFRFQACEAGRASLRVVYDWQPVLERTGIELVAGETTRLPEIDLRNELHSFTLTFALASGAPWLSGHIELLEPDGETANWVVIGPSARVSLLAPRSPLDLWVAGRGARPTLFEGVVDGDRLVLSNPPSIVLRVPREIPMPLAPLELVVRGLRTNPEEVAFETDDDTDGGDATVGADGLARLSVPWPGEYELAWCVRHTGTGVEFDIDLEELQTLAVDDSTAATIVDARLAPDQVAQAMLEATGR